MREIHKPKDKYIQNRNPSQNLEVTSTELLQNKSTCPKSGLQRNTTVTLASLDKQKTGHPKEGDSNDLKRHVLSLVSGNDRYWLESTASLASARTCITKKMQSVV